MRVPRPAERERGNSAEIGIVRDVPHSKTNNLVNTQQGIFQEQVTTKTLVLFLFQFGVSLSNQCSFFFAF